MISSISTPGTQSSLDSFLGLTAHNWQKWKKSIPDENKNAKYIAFPEITFIGMKQLF